MRIFVICKVRGLTEDSEEYRVQKEHVDRLERKSHAVHWPPRDTKQKDPEHGTGICRTTFWKIFRARMIYVIYDPTSEGFVADLMMTFALNELGKHWVFSWFVGRRKVVIANQEAVWRKIAEEVAEQVKKGTDWRFAKSYTMVLRNLAEETANL